MSDHFDCDRCPEGTLRPTTGHGRTTRGKAGVVVRIPDSMVILTCDSCGARLFDGAALDWLGRVEDASL